jgi:hypothetical protein
MDESSLIIIIIIIIFIIIHPLQPKTLTHDPKLEGNIHPLHQKQQEKILLYKV